MSRKEVKCRCGEKLDFPEGFHGRAKDVIDRGWGIVPTFEGKIIYSCGTCYGELKTLAERMYELSGNKYISVSHLIKD